MEKKEMHRTFQKLLRIWVIQRLFSKIIKIKWVLSRKQVKIMHHTH